MYSIGIRVRGCILHRAIVIGNRLLKKKTDSQIRYMQFDVDSKRDEKLGSYPERSLCNCDL